MDLFRKISRSIGAGISRVNRREEGVRILMYHRVSDRKGDRLSVSPPEFRKQMEYLQSLHRPVISLSGLMDEKSIAPSSVVLTFDDGYRDFYDNVLPVLKEYALPAAVFVVPGFIDGTVRPENVRLAAGADPLSWNMCAEIARERVSIGSHSLSHRQLTELSPADAEGEIKESGRVIEKRLGIEPEWFSYPRGKFNRSIADLVRKSGFRGAVTVRPGQNRPPFHYFHLRRTEISGDDTISDFAMKLDGAYDFVHFLWQKFRGDRL